jgi:alkylhydroperoxidase family enzyme
VLRWTDAFLAESEATPELRREALAHFSAAQLVELAAANAIFMGFSKIALALGDVPDDMPVLEQPTPDVA